VCSPDARSLRLPGHLPEERRIDQAEPGDSLIFKMQRVVMCAVKDGQATLLLVRKLATAVWEGARPSGREPVLAGSGREGEKGAWGGRV
jgi:hypothetical protein